MQIKSIRLEAALELLKEAVILADVGTDHGYFPIMAIKRGLIQSAYATDNKSKPLAKAKENIELFGLTSQIKTMEADGLSFLTPEIDTVSILGMGGHLIRDILRESSLQNVRELILGPNNNCAILRDYLEESGWMITDERFVRDQGHDYQLIQAQRGTMRLSDAEKEYGPILLKTRNALLFHHIEQKISVLLRAQEQAQDESKKAALAQKITQLRGYIE